MGTPQPGADTLHLEAIAVFQHPSNCERLRSIQVYSQAGQFRALRQDFLLSPQSYHLLEDPTVNCLEREAAVSDLVMLHKEYNRAEGWKCILEFAVLFPFPSSLDPLVSPKRNPKLCQLPTLVNDLAFVESVLEYLTSSAGSEFRKATSGQSHSLLPAESSVVTHQQTLPDVRSSRALPGTAWGARSTGFSATSFDGPAASVETPWQDDLLRSLGRFVGPFQNPALPMNLDRRLPTGPNTLSTPGGRSYPPPISPSGHLPTPVNETRRLTQPGQPRLLARLPSIKSSQPASFPVLLQPGQNRQLQAQVPEPGSFPPFQPARKRHLQVEIPQTPRGDFFASPDSVLVAQQLSLPGSWEVRAFLDSAHRNSNQWTPSPRPPPAPTPSKRPFTDPPSENLLGTAPAWLGGHAADDFSRFAVRSRSQEPQIQDTFWGAQTSSHMGGGQAKGRKLRKIASESELLSIPHPPMRSRSVSLGRGPEVSFQKPLQAEDRKGDLQAEALRGLVASFFPGPKRALAESSELPATPGGLPQTFLRGAHSHPFPNTTPLPFSTGLIQGGPTVWERHTAGPEAEDPFLTRPDRLTSELSSGSLGGSDVLSSVELPPAGGYPAVEGRSPGEGTARAFDKEMSQPERVSHMTLETLTPYFDLPIKEACKKLRVGATILKRHCRQLGVARWPHRKIKSIQGVIRAIEGFGGEDAALSNQVSSVIQQLKVEKERIDKSPDRDLAAGTKKLRQACFKATYQMKNAKRPETGPVRTDSLAESVFGPDMSVNDGLEAELTPSWMDGSPVE